MSSIFKHTISKYVLEDIEKLCGAPQPDLARACYSKEDLKALKDAVKLIRPKLDEDTRETVKEELAEIVDDLKFLSTKRGKYVDAIQEWHAGFHKEFLGLPQFEKIVIGGHVDKIVVFVTGVIKDRETFQELVQYVESKNPPFPILTKVYLGAFGGELAE
jgi:hypothetical protein